MFKVLVYGGYHNSYVYSEHLAYGLSSLPNVKAIPILLPSSKYSKIEHYFPKKEDIRNNLESLIENNSITHIINYNTNHIDSNIILYLKNKYNINVSAYYNDSPFSSHPSKIIYYFNQKSAFKFYDHIFIYRDQDKEILTSLYKINDKHI